MDLEQIFFATLGRYAQGVRPNDQNFSYYQQKIKQFAANVLTRFSAVSAAGVRCTVMLRHGSRVAACGGPAAASCSVCAQNVCLSHGAVWIETGEIVCGSCVAPLYEEVAASPTEEAPDSPEEIQRQHYLHVLGLTAEATELDIQRAFKQLALSYHPDRNRSARAGAAAARKMKALTEAYHWLKDHPKAS